MTGSAVCIIVGWAASLVALAATVWAVARNAGRRGKTEPRTGAWTCYIAGIFVTVLALVLGQEFAGLMGAQGSPKVLDALLSTLQMFGMGRSIELDTEALAWMGPALPAYRLYNAALYLAAPVGTIGTVISLLDKLLVTARLRRLARSRDVFAFSALDDRSLALARSVAQAWREKGRDVLLVFAGTDADAPLADEARGAGALCMPHSLELVAQKVSVEKDWTTLLPQTRRRVSALERSYVVAGADETANLTQGIALARLLAGKESAPGGEGAGRQRPASGLREADGAPLGQTSGAHSQESLRPSMQAGRNGSRATDTARVAPTVLIFSTSDVAGPVVDAVAQEVNAPERREPTAAGSAEPATSGVRVRIQRIDWTRSAVDDLLDRFPLFAAGLDETCMTQGDGFAARLAYDAVPGRRRVLVVGGAPFARTFVKGALWASRMGDQVQVRIDAVAADAEAMRARLAFEAPEFFAHDGRPYQGCYDLHFEQIDPLGGDFLDYLRTTEEQGDPITYALVALGDDLANAQVARRMREVLEQARLMDGFAHPPAFVAAVVESAPMAQAVRLMKARKRWYGIEPVGDFSAMFSYGNALRPQLGRLACNLNRIYGSSSINERGADFDARVAQADLDLANSEYNRRSSAASALHRKYSLYLFCLHERPETVASVDWGAPLGAMDGALLSAYRDYIGSPGSAWISEVEHDRWSAYVSSEGHEYLDARHLASVWELEGRHTYDLARLHPCLVAFDDLPALDEAVLPLRGSSPQFQQLDDDVLRSIRIIAATDDAQFAREWAAFYGRDHAGAQTFSSSDAVDATPAPSSALPTT